MGVEKVRTSLSLVKTREDEDLIIFGGVRVETLREGWKVYFLRDFLSAPHNLGEDHFAHFVSSNDLSRVASVSGLIDLLIEEDEIVVYEGGNPNDTWLKATIEAIRRGKPVRWEDGSSISMVTPHVSYMSGLSESSLRMDISGSRRYAREHPEHAESCKARIERYQALLLEFYGLES